MSGGAIIGDLGCMGVDLEKFRASNRVPMFRNEWNRWIFLRTTRDNPDDATITATLRATLYRLNKENSDWGSADLMFETVIPDGPRAGQRTVRVGHCDYLHVTKISQTPISFPRDAWPRLLPAKALPARRESVDPVPTLSTTRAVWVECAFVWRGTAASLPWPVFTGGPDLLPLPTLRSTQQCPIDADWILSDCALPPKNEPAPLEKTPIEKANLELNRMVPTIVVGGGLVLAGVALVLALQARAR